MKFTTAWADVAAKNVTLKIAVILLSLSTMILGVASAKLSLRDPLIIERSCFSKALSVASNQHTSQEIEAFVREALAQRFNSESTEVFLLSSDEQTNRTQEEKEMNTRGMKQRLIVNSVKADGNTVQVDADRLISVGQIRSALPFPLTVIITTASRSQSNPYGLLALKVSPLKKEIEK
jgi:hypothetical protein